MNTPKRPYRKRNMNGEELRAWILRQCEETPAPYPDLGEPCQIWTRYTNGDGYGRLIYHGNAVKAHRLMFRLRHGRWPTDYLCHKCDRPACLTLSHLFEGSQKENMADMVQKQRQANHAGEDNGNAKLDEEQVRAIRALAGDISHTKIGALFGLTHTQISSIVRRKSWRHVD